MGLAVTATLWAAAAADASASTTQFASARHSTPGLLAAPGSPAQPGWASVTVQLTPHRPVALAALARSHGLSARSRHGALAAAAPSSGTASTVEGFLIHAGLTVTARTAFSVTATGPLALVNSVFPAGTRVPVTGARAAGHVTPATATASPLVVPPALAGLASFVVGGADTSPVAHPLQVSPPATSSRPAVAPPLISPAVTPAPLTGALARALYSVPAAATTADGQGITVATIQLSGWDNSNLASFATNAGLPNPVATGQYQAVSVDSASTTAPDGSGGDIEFALDQETLLAVAPKANQVAYVAPNTTQGFVDAFNTVANDALNHRAGLNFTALSVSWGQCEAGWSSAPNLNMMDAAIQNVVAAGVTVFAASGDSGAYDCSTSALAVDYPASDPNVIAVGGLTTDPLAQTETTWWNSSRSEGGGGGQSVYWQQPSWQSRLAPPSGGTTLTGDRLVPDISLDADPASGFRILAQGGWSQYGGTSLAAPLAAATLTDLQIANGASSSYGLGNIAQNLYAAPGSSFRDTTTGSNGHFPAGSGYDLATGLGAPLWSQLSSILGPSVVVASPSSTFATTSPCRVFDTRPGTGTGSCAGSVPLTKAPIAAGHVLTMKVTGVGGVPANATAVVMNLTAVGATAPTYVSAYPAGRARPGVSNLNVNNAGAVPNLAIVPVGLGGYIDLYNAAGRVNLVGDISGYFAPRAGAANATVGPCRVFDTRPGTGTGSCAGSVPHTKAPIAAGHVLTMKVTGVGGVPANATAVVMNLTAVGATAPTYVSAYPAGRARPGVSNLNVNNAGAVPNLAIVPVGAGGYIDLYNAAGRVNLVGDISGYFAPGAGAANTTVGPCRVFDTRTGTGTGSCAGSVPLTKAPIGGGQVLTMKVTGVGGVPANATAVVMNLTAAGATTPTYVSAYAAGRARPGVSNLNVNNAGAVPNLAIVPVGAGGYIDLYNAAGRVNLVGDISGYFAP